MLCLTFAATDQLYWPTVGLLKVAVYKLTTGRKIESLGMIKLFMLILPGAAL